MFDEEEPTLVYMWFEGFHLHLYSERMNKNHMNV
jgi:hypothetical protein